MGKIYIELTDKYLWVNMATGQREGFSVVLPTE